MIKAQEITPFPLLIILLATRLEFVSGQFVSEAILSQVVIADNIAAYYSLASAQHAKTHLRG